LRDNENIRLKEDIVTYFLREVQPHVLDAWADGEKIAPAYEINFNRYFYTYNPPRLLAEIDADIKNMEEEIVRLLREVTS
jgi:type I restriction enzyme M protein